MEHVREGLLDAYFACFVCVIPYFQSYTPGKRALISKYSILFSEIGISVITDLSEKVESKPCILIKDIEGYRDEIFTSEIGQLFPNYGSSSDTLRLRILYQHGGCYFDQDVYQNPNCPLQESDVFKHRERHCLILEHRPQRPTPERLYVSYENGDSFKIKTSEAEKKSDLLRDNVSPREKSSGSDEAAESLSSDEAKNEIFPKQLGESSGAEDETFPKQLGVGTEAKDETSPKQLSESTDDSYSRFIKLKLTELGNDAIITTKENPVIKLMLDKLESHYRLNSLQRDKIIAECYGGLNRRDITIKRTGPSVQQEVISNIQEFTFENGALRLHCPFIDDLGAEPEVGLELHTGIEVDFEPMRSRVRELTCPQENDQNWLKVLVTKIDDGVQCRNIIIERIKFEARHFKILRLDDHLEHMAESMHISASSATFHENASFLLKEISKLDLQNVDLAQITFAFSETIKFCQANHLNSILNIKPAEFCMVVKQMTQFDSINFLLRTFEQRQNFFGIDMKSYVRNIPVEKLMPVQVQLEITLKALTLLSLPQNITQLSIESQNELCRFVNAHKEIFEYGAKLLSHLDDTILSKVGSITTSIERHQSLLTKPSNLQQINPITHDYSHSQKKGDGPTFGK